MEYAWNWAACQLDNGCEITAAMLVDPRDNTLMERRAIVVGKHGRRYSYTDVSLTASTKKTDVWRSVRSFRQYPLVWKLCVPSARIDLTIKASFPDQEFMTLIAKPAFWEGRCDVVGTFKGQAVTGLAYIERNGFDSIVTLKDFFKAVGSQVRESVEYMYPNPEDLTFEHARMIVADPDTTHYMDGVPLNVLQKTLMQPVREIADRGGKSWRSYGALACCDVVGGDSRKFVKWLAMPEFMHVGSLIVDDIQDESDLRRGGPCAHHIFGNPLCINSGTAAYFLCERMIKAPDLTPAQLNRVYHLYFAALRAGHAGQALDIAGLDYMMDDVVKTGDGNLLERRVLAIHRLKTAVPAASLAKMGALVGGGSEDQIEAVGRYFESIGVAFQIMDDVLNLRGLYSNKADLQVSF